MGPVSWEQFKGCRAKGTNSEDMLRSMIVKLRQQVLSEQAHCPASQEKVQGNISTFCILEYCEHTFQEKKVLQVNHNVMKTDNIKI